MPSLDLLIAISVRRLFHRHSHQKDKASVSLGGALRDIPKNGCEGDYERLRSRPILYPDLQSWWVGAQTIRFFEGRGASTQERF